MAIPRHWAGKDLTEIMESIPALIGSFDASHTCRFANSRVEERFGRGPDDVVGMHMREIVGEEQYGRLTPFLAQVEAGEQAAFDARVRDCNGTMRDLYVCYVPQFDDAGYNGFLVFSFEATSHQHRFRSVFDASPVAYWEVDYTLRQNRQVDDSARTILSLLRFADLNRAAELLFRINREDVIGRSIGRLWPASSEPDFEALAAAARAGERKFEVETRLLRSDATPVDVLLTCVFPESSDIRSTIMFGMLDLTERKARAAAVEALQNDLAHASRVATLGELTASIAHEVNQPLGAIVNNGSAALRWLNRPEPVVDEVRKSLELLIGEAKRASEIIIRMRAMASKGTLERRLLNPSELLADVEAIVARQVRALGSTLIVEALDDAHQLHADPVQMQQVLVNLVVNAAQAMSGQTGRREIRLHADEVADGIVFLVEDTGPGIPDDNIGAIFNAFYTTKATGMGIGLSVSKTIVEAHGGSIAAETLSPRGARFTVRLPYADESVF